MKRTGMHRSPRRKSLQGIALIEAMVGIIIFSVGVLGIVGLQSAMTKTQTATKFRGDAAYLASELIGTMWGDAGNLASYATASCTGYARCNGWKTKVGKVLPSGNATVTVAGGQVTVTVTWTTPSDGSHSYSTTTAIQL